MMMKSFVTASMISGVALFALAAVATTTSDSSLANLGLVDLTTSSSGSAATSTGIVSGYGADKLFDNSSAGEKNRYISTGSSAANPSIVTWTFNTATTVNAYMLMNSNYEQVNRAPKQWTFEGSTNGENWVTLDTRSDETSWGSNEKRYFSFANSTPYLHYRWSASPNSGDRVSLFEMEFYFMAAVQPLTVTAAPGELGTSSPVFGTQNATVGDTVSCSYAAPDGVDVRATCTGYSVSNYVNDAWSLSASGATSSFSLTMPDNPVKVVWNLADAAVKITATAGSGGSVSAETTWADFGDSVTITATPDADKSFVMWTGDTGTADIRSATIVLPADQPRTVVASFGGDLYVSATGSDANAGSSWETALASLKTAVQRMDIVGSGTIHVGAGTYSEVADSTAVNAVIVVTNNISIIGDPAAPESVIVKRDTSVKNRMFYVNHSEAVVSGLTIRGGNPTTSTLSGNGGNVYVSAGTVSDCIITNGTATADWNTGGGNVCMTGGRVTRCRIVKGTAAQCNEWGMPGGGVRITGGVLENCIVANNSASYAGVYITGTSARVINCTVVNNVGTESGGINAKNSAAGQVVNCLMYGNTASKDETGHAHVWSGASINNFVNCAGDLEGDGNILSAGESFQNLAAGDFRLIAGSPCIDAGAAYASTAAASNMDLDRNARISGAAVDIGAYEFDQNALSVGFSADKTEGTAPFAATFTAEPTGASGSVSYQWDVDGDGNYDVISDTPTVSYTYTSAGTYTVTVRAQDTSGGNAAFTRTDYIRCVPRDLYVSSGNSSAAWPYDTQETAAATVADAVAAAGEGSTVHVMPGAYSVSSTVRISSGIVVTGTTGVPEDAIIDGKNAVRGFILDAAAARLESLTVQNCKVATEADAQGGLVAIYAGGGTVSNCVLRHGTANSYWASAGGVDIRSPHGLVTHCIITNCSTGANNEGNGCAAVMIRAGGRLENSLVAHNHSTEGRAAVGFYGSVGGSVVNCSIIDNSAKDLAGLSLSSTGYATNCVMVGNYATEGGTEISNDGSVTNKFSVIRPFSGTAANAVACATDGEAVVNETCLLIGSVSDVFKNYENGDYRLKSGGPLINKGVNYEEMAAIDLAGKKRLMGGKVDIGCYEGVPAGTYIHLR